MDSSSSVQKTPNVLSQVQPLVQMNSVVLDFTTWLKEAKIADVAISFLIAGATLDVSKAAVSGLIMPVIEGMQRLTWPKFNVEEVATTGITFIVTMWIAFIIMRMLGLTVRPIPVVQVLNQPSNAVVR